MVCRFRFEQSIVPSCRSQVHTSGHTHGVEVARDARRAVMHAKDATTLAFFRSNCIMSPFVHLGPRGRMIVYVLL